MFRVRLDSSYDDLPWQLSQATADVVLVERRLIRRGEAVKTFDSDIDALRWLDGESRGDHGHAWVGYLGYELGQTFEPKACVRPTRPTATPRFAFGRVPVRDDEPSRPQA
ncbi:MAG: hypothetical protein AAF561_08280, partial [Planctomycetota bacterium]